MKFTTLFTLIGCGLTSIASVSALPAPAPSSLLATGGRNGTLSTCSPSGSITEQVEDIFGRADQDIFERYFNHETGMQISERDWAEGTIEPLERRVPAPSGLSHKEYLQSRMNGVEEGEPNLAKRLYAAIARAVIQGVIKIINFIKGKIEADKQVSNRFRWFALLCVDTEGNLTIRVFSSETRPMDWGDDY